MQCPKCTQSVPDDAPECGACGIIFSRWHEARERRPSAFKAEFPASSEASGTRISTPLLIMLVLGFVFFGVLWTAHRRELKSKEPKVDILNEINNRGRAAREQQHEREQAELERARADRRQAELHRRPPGLPAGLSEQSVRNAANGCTAFAESLSVKLPKSFQRHLYDYTLETYPSLFLAVRDGFVSYDPPMDIHGSGRNQPPNFAASSDFISVNLTGRGRSNLRVTELESEYSIDAGRRQVARIGEVSSSRLTSTVRFTWTYSDPGGAGLADIRNPHGWMTWTRSGQTWNPSELGLSGSDKALCKW